jgi:hypothetical protein
VLVEEVSAAPGNSTAPISAQIQLSRTQNKQVATSRHSRTRNREPAQVNVPATSSGFSGPVSGGAEVIESVERQGWRLSHMAYDLTCDMSPAMIITPASDMTRWAAPSRCSSLTCGFADPYERICALILVP